MVKKKSIEAICEKCGEKWKMGFNRLNKKKYTPCPECGEKISLKQIIMLVIEMDKIMMERKKMFKK